MKTTFYFVRHAKSQAEDLGIVQGEGLEVPLSEEGEKQAQALRQYMADFKFDKIFASKAQRAIKTADAIRMNFKEVPYDELSELNERSKGISEGMLSKDFDEKYPEIISAWKKEEDPRPDGGENFEDVEKRALPLLAKHLEEFPGQNILYVTHGNLIKVVLGSLLEMTHGKRARIAQDYCAINCVSFDHERQRWSVEYINRTCL